MVGLFFVVVVIVIVSFSFRCSSFHKCKQWGINPLLSTLKIIIQYKVPYSLNRSRTLINLRPRIGRLVALLLNLLTRAPRIGRTSARHSIMTTPKRNCQPQQQLWMGWGGSFCWLWHRVRRWWDFYWWRIATCLYSILFLSYLMFSLLKLLIEGVSKRA